MKHIMLTIGLALAGFTTTGCDQDDEGFRDRGDRGQGLAPEAIGGYALQVVGGRDLAGGMALQRQPGERSAAPGSIRRTRTEAAGSPGRWNSVRWRRPL